ncbi:MAG TPA: SDR family oxidoreductase [Oscillatoriaceae cyanobacterium M33_DOE_052]|uniref:SDR family oxidoreductase n=1 Tax=Planktothricoides sp. SpSt-374 TaxID=2282167 RepID=A0A7C3VUV4_9CYAN|nr:SDR family oxidoreductase [Oscillatoriaceae cyanobacterium M33_DOE_052]
MSLTTKKRALITGASSGIGRATALAFAKAGIDVALVSRSQEKLAAVAAAATNLGVTVKTYPVDLADLPRVKDNISAIVADFGGIDILVNNAGMGYTGTVTDTPLSHWQQVLDLNLTSPFLCIQGVLPEMRSQKFGLIVNVASISATANFPGWAAYNVSKAGLVSLSKTLAAEESAHGIRVTSLCPGAVSTPLWDTETVQADFPREAMMSPESIADTILHVALLSASAAIPELSILPTGGNL